MNEADQVEEERDTIEHYLRTLRKKVDHQLKNPFDFAFTNYSFAELATWKNNVLQLDATSRLYGQRVDFLHNGTMQILGSVLNNDPRQSTDQEKHEIKKQQIYDNAPYERNLEPPQKLNSQIVRVQSNILLWRQVCKKRDAISQLMLNELSTDQTLRLVFFPEEISANYESVLNNQSSIYMKLLDFRALSLNFLQIYKEIEEAVSESNMFMINFNGRQRTRGENMRIEQSFQLDFQSLDFGQPFIDRSFYVAETGVKDEEMEASDQENHIQELEVIEENDDEGYENESDYFSMDNWNRSEKQTKQIKPKKTRRKQQGTLEKKEELINFIGINPFRNEVLLIETDSQEEKFLFPPDYLHIKFVKYQNPYAKKPKKMTNASKMIKAVEFATAAQETTFIDQSSIPLCSDQNEGATNLMTSICKQSRQKFKEAALPIKEMKRMIKERVHDLSLPAPKRLAFQEVKNYFNSEEPLDIFISLLHVAAEEEIMLSI